MAQMRLNKAEKRALKFAVKNGLDLNEVEDMPRLISELVGNKKAQQFSVKGQEGYLKGEYDIKRDNKVIKTSDYRNLEEVQDVKFLKHQIEYK
jgi:hypothetical protein